METTQDKFKKIIDQMTEKELDILTSFIHKAKKTGEITELSFIHNSLKVDMSELKDWAEILSYSSLKTPPLVKEYISKEKIVLPTDYLTLSKPLDEVIKTRVSKRSYTGEALTLKELSTLLYFSYGVREYVSAYDKKKFPLRMSPSAGGLQGVELYFVVNNVDSLKKGLYHYNPVENVLDFLEEGNFRRKMVNLCTLQEFINESSVVLILTCIMNRLMWKYKIRSYRYIHMDAGFLGENIYLVGNALGLGICAVAGFLDDEMNSLLRVDGKDEFVTLVLTVGKEMPGNI